MARESTTLTVPPSEEEHAITIYQIFGWELLSSQEIFNQHTYRQNSQNVTTTTNYIKLTFSREKTMPHYARLKELEEQFHSIEMPRKRSNPLLKVGGAFIGVAAFSPLIPTAGIYICIPAAILSVVFFVFGFIKLNKNKKEYNEEKELALSLRKNILQEASTLS